MMYNFLNKNVQQRHPIYFVLVSYCRYYFVAGGASKVLSHDAGAGCHAGQVVQASPQRP